MASFQESFSGINQIGPENIKSVIADIEQAALELRLAERGFYKDVVQSLKQRNKKNIVRTAIICLLAASALGILYCQIIHCLHLS